MKEQARFLEPDFRSLSFVRIDPISGPRPMTISDQYEVVSQLELHAGVPDEIRSYFESVKTMCLYAFLYYPFYSIAQCFSAMAVELALRQRLPKAHGKDYRGLGRLLEQAVNEKIISESDFPLDALIRIRNEFVHAKAHWIVSPGMALPIMHVSVDLINALWPKP
jgi:hypothetical protein